MELVIWTPCMVNKRVVFDAFTLLDLIRLWNKKRDVKVSLTPVLEVGNLKPLNPVDMWRLEPFNPQYIPRGEYCVYFDGQRLYSLITTVPRNVESLTMVRVPGTVNVKTGRVATILDRSEVSRVDRLDTVECSYRIRFCSGFTALVVSVHNRFKSSRETRYVMCHG